MAQTDWCGLFVYPHKAEETSLGTDWCGLFVYPHKAEETSLGTDRLVRPIRLTT